MARETYLGNKNLKAAGVKLPWSQEIREEYERCANDIIYFTKTYCRIVHVDRGLINFDLWAFQEDMIVKFEENRFVICKMPRQVGKALDVETDILTPYGFEKLKNLKVGDTIYGPDGKETQITFITEEMNDRKCYEVEFSNGDIIVADAEHLWDIESTNWRTGTKTLTTEEIIPYLNKSNRPYIPFTKPLDMTKRHELIDPYTLGVWLGDGTSSDGTITCHKDDLDFYKTKFNVNSILVDKRNSNVVRVRIENLRSSLTKSNLIKNKHIPREYLFTDEESRLELLRGLMDTDGSVRKNGGCEFYQRNEDFIDQFRTLLATLGIKSTKIPKVIDGIIYYTVNFTTEERVFNLPRKADKQSCKGHPKNKRLYITSITEVESRPVRCLQVNNESHLFLAGRTLIPTHNTTTVAAYLLHKVLFNEYFRIAILANKDSQAREILGRLKMMFEYLPKWMQQGVVRWNEGDIELENESRIVATSTTGSSARGQTYNIVYLDEFAFVENNLQEKFFTSVYPVISSGTTTKVLITSTPNGMNLFYKIWSDSEEGRNRYVRCEVHWSMIPGRDEAWRDETIANTSERQFAQEFGCEFLGSSNTLIDAKKLQTLVWRDPINRYENLRIYENPIENHAYVMTVDTSRGVGIDNSAFIVVDVTDIPYRVVATYYDNEISPLLYPNIIYRTGMFFNNAMVLVEINDNGQQIADILHMDLEYDGVLVTQTNGRAGVKIGGTYKVKPTRGIRTTKQVKRIGCSNLKTLVESDKLLFGDYNLIYEMFRFVENKASYEAEEGSHDDLMACCFLFAWMTSQSYFKNKSGTDARYELWGDNKAIIEDSITPFGIFDDHQMEADKVASIDSFYNMDIHNDDPSPEFGNGIWQFDF